MRAALSLDLDNKWSYMKTHGDSDWQTYPSYIDVLVPRALDILRGFGWRITFFIVGQDAALPQNHDALAQIAACGHEIGNHSYFHEPWMHRREKRQIDDELARAEDSIGVATGKHTRGFRGPGFVSSRELLEVLVRRGYLYDASSLPTFIGPLGRYYYFRTAKLRAHERAERHDLFGKFSDGFRSNRSHVVYADGGALKEIPVTTMPGVRLPIHVSYVLYAATISPALALHYFTTALRLCKLTGTEPSILLHPLDFLSGQDCPELDFFPGMSLDPGVKADVLTRVLHELAAHYDIVPLEEFAMS